MGLIRYPSTASGWVALFFAIVIIGFLGPYLEGFFASLIGVGLPWPFADIVRMFIVGMFMLITLEVVCAGLPSLFSAISSAISKRGGGGS